MHDGSDEACCGTNGGYCGVEWRGTDGAEWIDIHDDACSGTDFFRVSPGCGIEVKTEWGEAYTYNEGSVLVCGYECECRATPGCDTVRYLRIFATGPAAYDQGDEDECEGDNDDDWLDWDEDEDEDEDCDIETSGDLNSSPSGTTNHGAGKGWCFSNLNNQIGCTASPADCWERCSDGYGDDLVAIDWWDDGSCDCQNDCECMREVGGGAGYIGYTVTRDSAVAALPVECGPTAAPTPVPVSQATPSDGGGNGGADAASAGIIGGAVAGVAVIAAIAVGAYVYMRRAKDSADSAPMAEVEVLGTITGAVESGALKDAAPDPSAPPLMPPPPPEPAQERPSMLSRLASWRAPAAEAPTGRNLFCTACGAPVQGPFCTQCGARVQ